MNFWWKGLIFILLLISMMTTWIQLEQVRLWMNKGDRFTAKDGQQLCERVKALERYSYGYREVGKMPLTCDYVKQK